MRPEHVAPLLVFLGTFTPGGATGQTPDSVGRAEPPSPSPSSPSALELLVKAGASYSGNFFQAPEGEPRESVRAGMGAVKVVRPFASGSYIFAEASGTVYSEFDPSYNVLGGFGWSVWPHMIQGYAGYRARTPRFDVADTLGFADLFFLHGSYGVRLVRVIQLEALVDYYNEAHGQRAERDNTFLSLGGALRYRGFGRLFSPELGAGFGNRDVAIDTEDLSERTLWLTVRSSPSSALSLRLRYRNRQREYSVEDAAASNFDREDRRHELALTTALSLRDNLRWTIYYTYQHATSTTASRNFDAHYVQTGLEYRLVGGRR